MTTPRSTWPSYPEDLDQDLAVFLEAVKSAIQNPDDYGSAGNHTIATDTAIGSSHNTPALSIGDVLVAYGTAVDEVRFEPIKLNLLANPSGNKTFNMTTRTLKFLWTNPWGNPMELEASGAYSGALLHVHQHTGNPSGHVHLVEVESEDADVHHFASIAPGVGTHSLSVEITGDTDHRFSVLASGELEWGPGNGAEDTNLYRSAADILKTDDAFECASIPEGVVTAHEAALSIAFAQMSDNIADGQVPESAVTQHEAALTIADGQIDESAVTQHEAALTIVATQVTAGAFPDAYTITGILTLSNDLNHDGSNVGLYGAAPVAQAADIGALTLTTHSGAPNTTLVDVAGSGDDATINDNLHELGLQINALRTLLRDLGPMA